MQVKAVYNQALTLHIVALAMCCVLGVIFVFFILLPTVRRIAHERRRVAELLSHVSHQARSQSIESPYLLLSVAWVHTWMHT